jgi:GNAT superfamily N-acetyltransferase
VPDNAEGDGPVDRALREERELVLTLGGYAVELPGGVLVVNERVPVPRFNFVQSVRLHRNRQSAFFERALDHYFQRALRPSIRVERPVPSFVHDTLHRLGFRLGATPWTLRLRAPTATIQPPSSRYEVRPAIPDELPSLTRLWAARSEGEELLRALSVAVAHPNPDERLVPAIALRDGAVASAALLHVYRSTAGIHAVVTQSSERGRGAATALVQALVHWVPPPAARAPIAIWSDSPRLDQGLARLGFEAAATFSNYSLPEDAELALPAVGPPGPPRWRPPRAGPARSD